MSNIYLPRFSADPLFWVIIISYIIVMCAGAVLVIYGISGLMGVR